MMIHQATFEVDVEDLRIGDAIGASSLREIASEPIDHGNSVAYVVRYANGEVRIEGWDKGTTVTVRRVALMASAA